MLHYQNFISDPYPDVIDSVTGDWLPKSYSDVKADFTRDKSERANKSSLKDFLDLLSIVK